MRRHWGTLVLAGTLVIGAPITYAQSQNGPDSGGPPASTNTERAGTAGATSGTPPTITPEPPREWLGSALRWASWSRMTGDWRRARTNLEDRGVSFEFTTTSDGSNVGVNAQRLGRALTTTAATIDLEKLVGLKGSRALVQYQFLRGIDGGGGAGIAQTFSNIDAPLFRGLAEAWLEQAFGPRARVKAGLIDANTEFAFVDNAGEFINSSMGFSPTVFPMPTYPDPHLGIMLRLDREDGAYASVGAFNGGPALGVDDFRAVFTVGETGLTWTRGGGGRAGIGVWRLRGRQLDENDVNQLVTTSGQYIVFDQTLWKVERDGASQSLGVFIQAGRADPRMSAMSSHFGAGLVGRGLLRSRPDDIVGIGFTDAGISLSTPDAALRHELVFETFHRFAITGWMALKPDLQIIKHPGGETNRRAIVAGTLRMEIIF